MKEKCLRSLKENRAVYITAILGAAIFVFIYGLYVLNPTYTDWLMTSEDGDLTQHYLGWKFFRHGGFRFPLGTLDTIAYPNVTSVIFTDSIPIFALFFKGIRFLLPRQFQYFGLWGILCFMLQGGFGAALSKKYVKCDYAAVAAGLFFVLSPVFIDRMFWMSALAAHFLCLAALYFVVYYEETFYKTKNSVLAWGILGALCAGIHLYFLPMCGVVLCGFVLIDIVKGRKKAKALLPLVSYIGAAAGMVFLLGGFGSGMQASNDGLGYYSFNLNGFFNPQGWSAFLKDMFVTDSQYEGFAYLGLGVFFLLVPALLIALGNFSKSKGQWRAWCRVHIKALAFAMMILLLVVLSASHVVMFGEQVLVEAKLPGLIYDAWSVFRASGRLIWPVVYLAVLGAVCLDTGYIKKAAKNLLLTVCLLLQFLDIGDMLHSKQEIYNKRDSYQTLLPSEDWAAIAAAGDCRHICFVSDMTSQRKLLFSFGEMASDYGFTLSNFYFARSLGEREITAREEALAALPEDTLFVFFRNEAQKGLGYELYYYEIDGLIVGSRGMQPGLTPLTKDALSAYRYDLERDTYFNHGTVTDGVWKIQSYGNTYGPYLYAMPGRYQAEITGENLTESDIKCYYAGGETNLEIQSAVVDETRIRFEFTLETEAKDLEVALWNVGGVEMTVTDITIKKQ